MEKAADQDQHSIAKEREFHQEIRFAVVMYGGVSLAIYIHGVAQELLRLARATSAPEKEIENDPVTQIYRRLSSQVRDQRSEHSHEHCPTRFSGG